MYANIRDLIGRTITEANQGENYFNGDIIQFACEDGSRWEMYHQQDCCEDVHIEDIAGAELADLVGETVLDAYESSNGGELEYDECEEWTFYTIRTMNHTLTIRWYGTSNGYYSMSAEFFKVA
jgi:hypothetical protein